VVQLIPNFESGKICRGDGLLPKTIKAYQGPGTLSSKFSGERYKFVHGSIDEMIGSFLGCGVKFSKRKLKRHRKHDPAKD